MKTYVIHVSDALEREVHIKTQINNKKLDYVFVNEGDKKDLYKPILEKYFTGPLCQASAATSCAYKHILAYEDMLANNTELALVLEDDIFLSENFSEALAKTILEIKRRNLQNFIVSLEDSNLRYVKGSERNKNQLLYKNNHGRMTGAYLTDRAAALKMMQEINKNKCAENIDWFHNRCSEKDIINIYWLHPTIATQGSLNGNISSLIGNKPGGLFRLLSFRLEKNYKKILWRLR
jgi:glycosyl transferase family 25